jgi:hypothetical protein
MTQVYYHSWGDEDVLSSEIWISQDRSNIQLYHLKCKQVSGCIDYMRDVKYIDYMRDVKSRWDIKNKKIEDSIEEEFLNVRIITMDIHVGINTKPEDLFFITDP